MGGATRRAAPPRSRATSRGRSSLALSLLALVLAACGREARPPTGASPAVVPALLLTQVPAGGRPAPAAAPGILVGGSRLVRWEGTGAEAAPRLLSEGLDAVGDVALHHDGHRVCFVGRERPGDAPALFVTTVDGGPPRRLFAPAAPCSAPAWLPDDRIVYAAAVPGPAGATGAGTGQALFVVEEGEGAERITFGGRWESDPSVLRDGRIVYVGWQAPETEARTPGGRRALFTVHPDGTGPALFHGPSGDVARARPRQAPDGTVYLIERAGEGRGRLRALDWRAPHEAARAIDAPGDVLAVEPMSDGRLLLACVVGDAMRARLHVLAPAGPAAPVGATDAAWETVHAIEVAGRRRPQGQLSMMRRDKDHGTLLCVDGRPRERPAAAAVRVRTWAHADPVDDGGGAPSRILRELGRTPLAADGSFYVRVPPDVPLRVEILDQAGRVLDATRTPFWVRPNEIRGCTGCHDAPDKTPPNRQPLAVQADPVPLRGRHPGRDDR